MNVIVADTSVLLAVALEEPERPWLVQATSGCTVIAPGSLPFEIVNAIAKMVRRGRLTEQEGAAAWRSTAAMAVDVRPVDMLSAMRLAHDRKVVAYDALVLQCAIEAGCPLVSLDRGLCRAALSLGIPIVEQGP